MEILNYEIGSEKNNLTCYIQAYSQAIYGSDKRPAVLILAGGGYEFVSDGEKEPVAMAYAARGFQTFTLDYSVKEKSVFPAPQREAFEAIAFLRKNADRFMIDASKIAVCGFSAGGHLAASTGVYWNDPEINTLPDNESSRPDALVLVYPCITAGEYAYPGINSVHGAGTEFREKLSLEDYAGKQTPPAYICHTSADSCVPSMNSLMFASALARAGVPYELHVFKDGPHGMSLATKAVSSPYLKTLDESIQRAVGEMCARFSAWLDESVKFLNLVFDSKTIEPLDKQG